MRLSLVKVRGPENMLMCAKCTCLRGYAKTLHNLPSSPARGNCCLAISRRYTSHSETFSSVIAGFRSAQEGIFPTRSSERSRPKRFPMRHRCSAVLRT